MRCNITRLTLSALLFALSLPAQAQQSKVYHLGVLRGPGTPEGGADLKGLRDGLREAGYLEGKNLQLNIPNVRSYDDLRPLAAARNTGSISLESWTSR